MLHQIWLGGTLVMTETDRLACSLSHLQEVIARLTNEGAGFKSLSDPIGTVGPSGGLMLQMPGAVAEFERALIRARTVASLKHNKSQGRGGCQSASPA